MSEIAYDKETKILSITVNYNKIIDSDINNDLVIDYDKDGKIVNIDVLNINLEELINL
ncbi:MAG: DUF2283 domain-containing protein [Candidatus Gracilibacteria bacterium]|jgi:uncharacterized protein YuzE